MKVITKNASTLKSRYKVELECYCCGKIFYKLKKEVVTVLNGSYRNKLKYCSLKCVAENKKLSIKVDCLKCGNKFLKSNAEISRTKNNFCSRLCSNLYYKDNVFDSDLERKIAERVRNRVRAAIKKGKPGSTIKALGCTVKDLMRHLEGMFYKRPNTNETMSWDNYGLYGWHIDHVIPLASFDLTYDVQFLQACNYKNLQPLWAEDNWKKNAKY